MTLKKLLEIRVYFLLGGLICMMLGMILNSVFFQMMTYLVILVWFVLTVLFFRCPHCGKFLGRALGEYCPHCGEKLEK